MLTPARSASQWAQLEEVQCIIYYDEWEVGGPTAFLPGLRHTGTVAIQIIVQMQMHCSVLLQRSPLSIVCPQPAGEGEGRFISEEDRQAMYANERCAKYHKGTVLMYQLGCWHRGTPVNYGYVRCGAVYSGARGFALRLFHRRQLRILLRPCVHVHACWSL